MAGYAGMQGFFLLLDDLALFCVKHEKNGVDNEALENMSRAGAWPFWLEMVLMRSWWR